MPSSFFENARQFEVNGGNFTDLKGNQNNYNYDQSLNVSGQGNSAVYSRGPYYNGPNNSITSSATGNGSIMVVGQGANYQGSPNPTAMPNLADQMNNYGPQNRSQPCSPPPAAQPCNPGIDSGLGNSALHSRGPYYNGPNNSINSNATDNGNIMVVGQGANYQGSPNPTAMPNLADQMNNYGPQNRSQPCPPPPAAQPCNPGIDSGQRNSAVYSRGPYYNGPNNSITSKATDNGNIMVVGQGASSQGSPNLNALANQMNIHGQSTQSYSSPPAAQPCNHGKDSRQGNLAVNSRGPCDSNDLVSQQSVSPSADHQTRPPTNPSPVTESGQAGSMMSGTTLINGPQPTHVTSPSIASGSPATTATEPSTPSTSSPVATQAQAANVQQVQINQTTPHPHAPDSNDLVSQQSEFSESLPNQNNGLMALCAAMLLNFWANQMNNNVQSPSQSYSPPPAAQPYSHGPSPNIPPPTHSKGIFSHSTGHVNQPHFTPQQQSPPAAHHSPPLPQQPVGPHLPPPGHHSQMSVNSAPANVQQVQINQSTTQPHAPHSNNLVSSNVPVVSQQSVSPPADHQARPSINPLPGTNMTESSQAGSMMSGTTLTNGPQPTHVTSPSIASAPPATTATEPTTSPPVVTQAETTPNSKPPSGLSEYPNLSKFEGTDSPSESKIPVEEDGKKKKKKKNRKFIFSISRLFRKKA